MLVKNKLGEIFRRAYSNRFELLLIFAIAVISTILGLVNLGKFIFPEEPFWIFSHIPSFFTSIEHFDWEGAFIGYQSGVLPTILVGISRYLMNWDNLGPSTMAEHLFIVRMPIILFTLLMIPFIYFLGRKLFGKTTALIMTSFIVLNPTIIGVTQVVNPNSTLWSTATISFLAYLLFLKQQRKRYFYLSGIFLGLAFLSKSFAIALPLLCFMVIYFEYLTTDKSKETFLQNFYALLKICLIGVAFYFILYPASWVNPALTLTSLLSSYSLLVLAIPLVFISVALLMAEIFLFKGYLTNKIKKRLEIGNSLILFLSVAIIATLLILFFNSLIGYKLFDLQNFLFNQYSPGNAPFSHALASSGYYLLFGLPLTLIFGLLLLPFASFKNMFKKEETPLVFSCLIFMLFYIPFFAVAGTITEMRHLAFIIPFGAIIAALAFTRILRKQLLVTFVLIVASILICIFARSQYLTHTNFLNLRGTNIVLEDGYSVYKAASELNKRPDAESLHVYTEIQGFNLFFKGKVVNNSVKEFEENKIDYTLLSEDGELILEKGYTKIPVSPLLFSKNFLLDLSERIRNFITDSFRILLSLLIGLIGAFVLLFLIIYISKSRGKEIFSKFLKSRTFPSSIFVLSALILTIIPAFSDLAAYSERLNIFFSITFILSAIFIYKKNTLKVNPIFSPRTLGIALWIVVLSFLAIRIGMPILYNGSYIDETAHLLSGIEFFETGHFAELNNSEYYMRGSYVSVIVGIFFKIFGQSVIVAKMIPVLCGIASFSFLYLIAKKIIPQKEIVLLTLFTYSIFPWTIINHFYTRMYAFYELFFLAIFYLFLKLSESFQRKSAIGITFFSAIIIAINLISFLFSYDSGRVVLPVFTGLAYLYIILTQTKLRSVNIIFKILPLFIALIAGELIFHLTSLFLGLINADIEYATPEKLKYGYYFFSLNLVPSLLFLGSLITIFKTKKPILRISIVLLNAIFVVHLISNHDMQSIRVMMYFFPFYFLLGGYFLSALNLGSLSVRLLIMIIPISALLNFPKNFLIQPNIPAEINYIDNALYEDVALNCQGSVLITSGYPGLAVFHGLKPDYFLNTRLKEEPDKYRVVNGAYIETYTGIPVITNHADFLNVFYSEQKACFIGGEFSINNIGSDILPFIENHMTKYPKTYHSQRETLFYIKN